MESAIVFDNVNYKANIGFAFKREKKHILKGLSGQFPANCLIGILGPSGGGKTTLLNILSGCIKNYTGTVHINLNSSNNKQQLAENNINNEEVELINFNATEQSTVLGYIQQETHLCGLLTLMETFQLAAELKIANRTEIKEKITELLNVLGLNKVDPNTRVANLSGGERKRLSIGLELLSDFSVILLDEPTTGLDSYSTRICMDYLKLLTTKGKTIICNIHQPSASILEKLEYIYVIADGYCVYEGDNSTMLKVLKEYDMECPHFHNPADYIVEIASDVYHQSNIKSILIDKYHKKKKSIDFDLGQNFKTNLLELKNDKFAVSHSKQLFVLLKREYLKALRNLTLTYLRLITSVTNSLVLCAIFWKVGNDGSKLWFNYNAIIGFVLQLMTPSLMLTILTFPTEFAIVRSESINRWYSLKWYYTAVTLIDFPISILYCVISNVIFYYLTEQPLEWWRFGTFSLFGFLICIIAQSLGLLVGSLMNVVNGIFVGSALSLPLMLFAGFGITNKDIPPYIDWVGYLSYLKYAVEGMAGSVMGYNRTRLPCPNHNFCMYEDAKQFLDDMGIRGDRIYFDIGVLLGIFLLLRILAYVGLQLRVFWKS